MKHLYLFTLEITPVEVGEIYDELPSHLTLMSRFLSDLSPKELLKTVAPIFAQTKPIVLTFGETTELGPKKLTVHLVNSSSDLKKLHESLRKQLTAAGVEYQYPQFIGVGHKPHVTKRQGIELLPGSTRLVTAAYLIEVIDKKRVIRMKYELGQQASVRAI